MVIETISPTAAAGRDLAALVERLRPSVVAVRSASGTGSGTAWRDGLVVTNAHVVRAERATVEAAGGARFDAHLLARDPERDLAALAVEGLARGAVKLREHPLRPGELVVALGHPWGGGVAATLGIVGAVPAVAGRAVVADIRLAPGNSGGPLVDAAGRVVGVNAMVSGGAGIAVPAATVEAFLAEGATRPAMLGVALVAVAVPGAAAGLLVTDVEPDSLAERSGLIPGDVIVGVDALEGSPRALAAALRRGVRSRPLRLGLLRGGERRTLDVLAQAA